MPLHTGLDLLKAAQAGGYGVGAYNTDNLETTLAIMQAAEQTRSPVMLAITAGAMSYSRRRIVDIALVEARDASVPVAVHLDHGDSFETCVWCIRHGFTSVMIDKSHEDEEANVRETRRVVDAARAVGVSVEAEIGKVGGFDAASANEAGNAFLTSADEAARFIEASGTDSLAIAVGTAHGPNKGVGRPHIALERIVEIRGRTDAPLVMHGSSSIPADVVARFNAAGGKLEGAMGIHDDDVRQAIANGMCKVNVGTDLRIASSTAIRELVNAQPGELDMRKILKPAMAEMTRVITAKMQVLGSAGRG